MQDRKYFHILDTLKLILFHKKLVVWQFEFIWEDEDDLIKELDLVDQEMSIQRVVPNVLKNNNIDLH